MTNSRFFKFLSEMIKQSESKFYSLETILLVYFFVKKIKGFFTCLF